LTDVKNSDDLTVVDLIQMHTSIDERNRFVYFLGKEKIIPPALKRRMVQSSIIENTKGGKEYKMNLADRAARESSDKASEICHTDKRLI
jgi:hypothetical protein